MLRNLWEIDMSKQHIFAQIGFFIACSVVSSSALSAPTISQAIPSDLVQGGTLLVQGTGFVRESSVPYAVMFDFGEQALTNGRINTHHESLADGTQILRIDKDPNTLWSKPSVQGVGTLPPSLVRIDGRSAREGAHYQLRGYNSFLGWPSAYGGDETPVDNSKLYVAWYLKLPYDPRYYWTISSESLEGKFSPGEKVRINGSDGRFIGIGTDGTAKGMHHFEIPGHHNANALQGETIVGLSSGAKIIFPTKFAAGTGVGYESPGSNKYIRVWEDPQGKEGVRISWTQMQVHTDWAYAPVTPNEWHLMEFFLDTDKSSLEVYTDRELVASVDASDEINYPGKWSPTIALLGFNGKTQEFQDTRLDDIYMDKSFARVVIGDKAKFSELKHYELQYPLKWTDNSIEVKLNFGGIDPRAESYLYVINESGDANEEGFPLCEDCETPPSKINLQIR